MAQVGRRRDPADPCELGQAARASHPPGETAAVPEIPETFQIDEAG